MICKVKLGDKTYNIEAWKVGDEKSVLIEFANVAMGKSFNEQVIWLFERLTNIDSDDFTINQMLYALLQVSAQINIPIREYTAVCPKCGNINPVHIDIVKACKYSEDAEYEINAYHINDITQDISDEFSLEEHRDYQELKAIYEAEQIRLEHDTNCLLCQEPMKVVVTALDILQENIIKLDISYYYDLVFVLVSFGFSIADIDNMLPYELEIYKRKVEEYHDKQKKAEDFV